MKFFILGITTSLLYYYWNTTEPLRLPFPNSTSQCDTDNTALFMVIADNCNIRVDIQLDVNKVACYEKFNKFEIKFNSSEKQIYFLNLDDGSNGSIVNFMCIKRCNLPECRVVNYYISSHQIISKIYCNGQNCINVLKSMYRFYCNHNFAKVLM